MLNYSKKLDKKIFILGLLIFTIFLLATTIQTDFAATNSINNTTNGGISGALNSSSPGDIIELDEGTYTGNNNTNMSIDKNITIQGKTKDKVILDAQGLSRIFTINDNLNVTFINITFINANIIGNQGSAICNYYAGTIMKFINCTFTNNTATATTSTLGMGAAIYTLGNMTIIESNFKDNKCIGTYNCGGAIYTNNSLTVIDSTFTNNTCPSMGGAICIVNGTLNIIGTTFDSCSATRGGALSLSLQTVIHTVTACTFINNSATQYGGAINTNCNIIISDSLFINNNALDQGGAIRTGSCNLTIDNTIFINNTAIVGGAIHFTDIQPATSNSSVNNSNFINNSAINGGAINIQYGNLTLSNSNILNNSATNGVISVNYDGTLYVSECNITDNTGNSTIKINNGTATITNNNITDNEGHGISNDGDAYIDNNIISGNGKDGINNGENGTAIIVDNEISDNGGNGVTNDGDAVIDDNLISGNVGDGINNGENGTADIVNNVIIDNEGHGISNDGDAYIDNNIISGNGKDGINNGENGTADIVDNLITDNGGNGVTNDGNATLIDNEITDNNGDGVVNNGDLNGSGNTIAQKPILTITTNVSNRTINITVKATDKMGNIIVGATIKIYVNGSLIGTGTTNNEGIVEFTYTATSVGTQNILTTMDAFNITDTDNNEILYSTANNTTTVNITTKANTRSTIVISNATSGKSTIIRGVLIDENGNTIANAPINLVIGGKSNNLVTGADGSWSLSYTPLKAGNFIAKVYYNGNNNYMASTSSLNYTVAQGTDAPKKTDIRLLKKKSSKVFRHGKRVVMKWYTYKNYGATGSKNITTKVIIKNLKYKLWKVYNKKLNYKYGNNKIKFKLNLKSGEKFKLKLKVYKPIR